MFLVAPKEISSYTHGKGKRHAQKVTSFQCACKPLYLFQLQRRWVGSAGGWEKGVWFFPFYEHKVLMLEKNKESERFEKRPDSIRLNSIKK